MANDSFSIPNSFGLIYPGFSGFAGIVDYNGTTLRVESCNVKATQAINAVDDVDGAVSHGRFQLMPLLIGGDMSFKFDIFSVGSGNGGNGYQVALALIKDAYDRDRSTGNLAARQLNKVLNVRYHSGFNYEYHGILVNTFNMTINAGSPIDIRVGLKGISRTQNSTAETKSVDAAGMNAPIRVATYNDVEIVLEDNGSDAPTQVFNSNAFLVRDFNFNLDNQIEDIHTLSGRLRPYDLVAKKRKINGSFKILSNPGTAALRQYIQEHEKRAISRLNLTLNLNKGGSNFDTFMVLPGVVPTLEDVQVSPSNVVELTFNYEAYGSDINMFQNVQFPDVSTENGFYPFE